MQRESEYRKEPRSSRPCLLCGHLRASHIDVCCLKVVEKSPRKECDCRGFIGTNQELEILRQRQKNTQIVSIAKEISCNTKPMSLQGS